MLKEHHEGIAALSIESIVQGASGMIVMPEGYLAGVRELCTTYDVLMIVDEVATGFGRTGKMFACEHENVQPDLMGAGKGITGGYLPIAVTFATEDIYKAFYDDYENLKTFFHGHSYTGNQLGCAVALENLALFESENIVEQVAEKVKSSIFFFKICTLFLMLGIFSDLALCAVQSLSGQRKPKNLTRLIGGLDTKFP